MEHIAGKTNIKDIRIGDTVVDNNAKPLEVVTLNYGYALPSNLQQGLRVIKMDLIMGEEKEIYLSKEEIFQLYLYFADKGQILPP